MGRVDHQPLRLARVASQFGKNLVEHAKAAPAHKSVIDRLVRTVLARSIAPPQTVPYDIDDPTDHPPVIHSRNPVRQRKIRLDPAHLRLRTPVFAENQRPPLTVNPGCALPQPSSDIPLKRSNGS